MYKIKQLDLQNKEQALANLGNRDNRRQNIKLLLAQKNLHQAQQLLQSGYVALDALILEDLYFFGFGSKITSVLSSAGYFFDEDSGAIFNFLHIYLGNDNRTFDFIGQNVPDLAKFIPDEFKIKYELWKALVEDEKFDTLIQVGQIAIVEDEMKNSYSALTAMARAGFIDKVCEYGNWQSALYDTKHYQELIENQQETFLLNKVRSEFDTMGCCGTEVLNLLLKLKGKDFLIDKRKHNPAVDYFLLLHKLN